jgi:hypothetical protein
MHCNFLVCGLSQHRGVVRAGTERSKCWLGTEQLYSDSATTSMFWQEHGCRFILYLMMWVPPHTPLRPLSGRCYCILITWVLLQRPGGGRVMLADCRQQLQMGSDVQHG